MQGLNITAAEAVTAIGLTAATTAAAVRAGINRVSASELYPDVEGYPLSVALLPNDDGFVEPFDRMGPAALQALRTLMRVFSPGHDHGRPCHLLLGGAHPDRGGALYSSPEDLLPVALASELTQWFGPTPVQVFPQGNPSAMFALVAAAEILQRDPRSVCIVGAVDSLLDAELLERFEEEGRLTSEGHGCPHGLTPGEAAGFLVVESARVQCPRPPLALIESVAVGHERHPYTSEDPSLGEGLSDVCWRAMLEARVDRGEVDAVLIDLDGEHHRALEWAYAEVRRLGPREPARTIVHPAEGYGSIGAASGVLLLAIAAESRGWLDGVDLVLAADDEGPRGAAVVRRQWRGH